MVSDPNSLPVTHLYPNLLGVLLSISYKCITTILHDRNRNGLKWLAFIGVLFLLGTANLGCFLHFSQLALIDRTDYPNGPAAFLSQQQANGANIGSVATSIIMVIFSNMFMVKNRFRVGC